VPDSLAPSPAEIRRLRTLHPDMRERDFARIHRISEAQLVAAQVGGTAVALRPDVKQFLQAAPGLGEVLALTRNESAVHEKIGAFEDIHYAPGASMVLGSEIDLRLFPSHFVSAFAVTKTDKDGSLRRSLQFFDGAGDAVHKVHLRPASSLEAYDALVESLRLPEQSDALSVVPADDAETVHPERASRDELRAHWEKLTDTHQFHPMLRKLKFTRHQAVSEIDSDFAWPLDPGAIRTAFDGAVATELPIMVFVGNRGCIQIHSGPLHKVEPMGPWLNVLDETFHMHLRLDQIAELWAVRKPTADGHVTSIEAFGADRKLIVQCFGQRQEGTDERAGWRSLVESLTPANRSNAA
jgi:putative hemin transport protein